MKKKRWVAGIAFLLAGFLWIGEVEAGNRLKAWPLFYYAEDARGTKRKEALGPFLYSEQGKGKSDYGFRPLFNIRKDEAISLWEGQFLWPIGWYRNTPEKKNLRIFPVYYYHKDTPVDGQKKSSYKLLPIIFGGQTEGEGSYFAFFPIAGKLNNWLGKDRIHFFLFPLYTHTTDDEYQSRYFLWPIFSYAKGKGEVAYRFWPLYGHGHKIGEYRKDFFLWPFFNFQMLGMDKETPTRVFWIWPFYAKRNSPYMDTKSVLWPFFTYTDDKRRGYEEWHFPWPVLSRTRGEDREGHKFWPLWGYMKKNNNERFYALWPLFWSRKDITDNQVREKKAFLPFYWSHREIWKVENESSRYIRLWPLISYERDRQGETNLSFLSLLWFRDKNGGFQRNYAPLWTFYECGKDETGYRWSRALWRLYKRESTPFSHSWELAYLLDYQKEKDENKTHFSFLKGLLGYERTENKKKIQLFYFIKIPL